MSFPKTYHICKLLGFSAQQMYTVVADIEHYALFLPFCQKSTILTPRGAPPPLLATLHIGYPPFVEHYTSHVTLVEPHYVRAQCHDGRLFRSLESRWKFRAPGLPSEPQSCIIDYRVQFEFKSKWHAQVAVVVFDQLGLRMERAFVAEARRRYGAERLESRELEVVK